MLAANEFTQRVNVYHIRRMIAFESVPGSARVMITTPRAQYSPRHHIADGNLSSILSAFDETSQRKVAIKVTNLATEQRRKSFVDEANVLSHIAQFDTPHVCEVFDVGVDVNSKTSGVVVMQQYEEDLFSYFFERDPPLQLTELDIKHIFKSICIGVESLHVLNVAHLDIKLENVFIDDKGVPYLGDLGSAVLVEEVEPNEPSMVADLGLCGTQNYYAPEVLAYPQLYDPFKADIFSLGIILHVLITSKYPFDNPEHIPDITSLRNSDLVSFDCIHLLDQLLELQPHQRINISQVLAHPWFTKEANRPRNPVNRLHKYLIKKAHKLFH